MAGALTWTALLLSFAWFLLAAKVHGRQIRLERELQGFTEVSFDRRSTNPPQVEALWRHDRIRFWSTVTVLTALVALVLWTASLGRLPRPFRELPLAGAATGLLLWVGAVSFLSNAFQSLVRFERRRHDPRLPGPGGDRRSWDAAVRRGTLAYWAAAAALGGAVVITGLV